MKKRRIGFLDGDDEPRQSPTIGTIQQLTDHEPDQSDYPRGMEVRFSAISVNGAQILSTIESHAGMQSIADRAEEIIGRFGFDGNLATLAISISVPRLDALRASRDAVNRAIAMATRIGG